MIENLRVKNFRLFRDLEIDCLERINLLAGRNNAGKTSVLEAILLMAAGGEPDLLSAVAQLRELGDLPSETLGAFWRPMFSELDTRRDIEIKGRHSQLGDLVLTISRERRNSLTRRIIGHSAGQRQGHGSTGQYPGLPSLPPKDDPGRSWGIGLSWTTGHNDEVRRMRLCPDGNCFELTGEVIPLTAALTAAHIGNVQDDAVLLGQLRARKQGNLVTEALRTFEPRLVSVEDSSANGPPMICADIGLPELIPLSAMGEGMTRIARMVLAMSSVRGGVLLVDEIETAIHHSVMRKLWEVVAKASQAFDVQVFATTHSFECLAAAQEALRDGWRFHRLERAEDGSSRCVTFEPEDVGTVVTHGLEVR